MTQRFAYLGQRAILTGLVAIAMAACSSGGPYSVDMMPAPDVYDGGTIDPFETTGFVEAPPQFPILYATDRAPIPEGEEEKGHRFYGNTRGHILRVGEARIEAGMQGMSWEEARQVTLLKTRGENYPLKVAGVTEYGVVPRSLTAFYDPDDFDNEPTERFVREINARMAATRSKDVVVYVHGYKVNFENPILVASELWHFLGYKGAFVAYSWPSTPKTLAYVSDLEDATNAARNFREFLWYIASETEVERIHVIGYSAGTRMVTRAIADWALQARQMDVTKEEIVAKTKLHHTMLIGSDVDKHIFAGYLADGWFRTMNRFTVYTSGGDAALGMSQRVFGKSRVGQSIANPSSMSPHFVELLEKNPNFMIVDVTDAQGSLEGNGHSYFRSSPWVSSDVLMSIFYDLAPDERGLVRDPNYPIWSFPEDYVDRLRGVLADKGVILSNSAE